MTQQFQAPRGTTDILPEEQQYWRFVEEEAVELSRRFGYERIDTPVFESAELFVRGVGDVTDIVEKETYNFDDRGGDRLTLRPEGTAPVCRAYLQHGMHNLPQPVRLYYFMPMYRYERPQAGRYREFRQFGIEAIGDVDASVDAEVVEFASLLLESYGIPDVTLLLNSIGDRESRPAYIHKLKAYFEQFEAQLSPEDKRRLETNPLRLLDSKEESIQPLLDEAPKSLDNLSQASRDHWNGLLGHLGDAGIEFEIDHRLVRGLDYYTRTVFEFVPPGGGSQSTIVAGGRYDGLMEQLGGKPTPGIGFAMGMERVIEDLEKDGLPSQDADGIKVLVAHMGEPARAAAMALASSLRSEDLAAVVAPSGRSLKSQLRYASSVDATHALIIGDDELKKGTVVLRDLLKSEQQEMVADDLAPHLKHQDSAPQADK